MVQDLGEGIVSSAAEVRSLAASLARQAGETYAGLAERMRELGNSDAAAAFEQIGTIAASHHLPSETAAVKDASRVFDHEDMGASRLITPYEAFSLAVRNSERAFAYWTHVSANAEDPNVSAEAEQAARVEMGHVRELRAGRRRAFHDGRRSSAPSTATSRDAAPAATIHQFAAREATLAALHRQIAERLQETGDEWAKILAEIAAEEDRNAGNYGPAPKASALGEPLPEDRRELLELAVERLEAAVELYLRTAEESRDEHVVGEAQVLASNGVLRLARLRNIELRPSPIG